jgi:hypothetical protein
MPLCAEAHPEVTAIGSAPASTLSGWLHPALRRSSTRCGGFQRSAVGRAPNVGPGSSKSCGPGKAGGREELVTSILGGAELAVSSSVRPPFPPTSLLRRARLLRWLDQKPVEVTLVCGHAGAGKTSLLAA